MHHREQLATSGTSSYQAVCLDCPLVLHVPTISCSSQTASALLAHRRIASTEPTLTSFVSQGTTRVTHKPRSAARLAHSASFLLQGLARSRERGSTASPVRVAGPLHRRSGMDPAAGPIASEPAQFGSNAASSSSRANSKGPDPSPSSFLGAVAATVTRRSGASFRSTFER